MLRISETYHLLKGANFSVNRKLLSCLALTLIVLTIVGTQSYVPVAYLTRDASVVSGSKFYAGLISNIGLFLWCSSGAVALFSSLLLKRQGYEHLGYFLFSGSIISFILFLDDFLLLHELVFPDYLGISEKFFVLLYPLMLLSFSIFFLKVIVKTQVVIFALALCFLALSMALDKILPHINISSYLLEDGFKLLGIVGWSSYFTYTSFSILMQGASRIHFEVPADLKIKPLELITQTSATNPGTEVATG